MGRGHSPLLRAPLSLLGRPRSVPETVDPEMTGTVLRGTQTSVPPSPGEGRGLFPPLSPLTSGSTAPTFSIKEQFPSSLGLSRQVLIVSDALLPHTQTRGMNLPLNTVELRDVLLPRTPLNSLWDWEDQVSADSTSLQLVSTSGRYASRVVPPFLSQLPHRGYVGNRSVDPACTEAGGVVSAAQPVLLAYPDGLARLRNSVCQAPSQVQRRPFYIGPNGQGCLCPACRDCGPLGEGCNIACPSSRDEFGFLQSLFHRTQEVTANPGSASLESVPAQAYVQDADAETHPFLHSTPGLVCRYRPEGRILSCLDSA